jgi:hypothetical protein
MSTFGSNLELHNSIGKALEKLTNGDLTIHELENLSELSRELYDRVTILKYKAYETQVKANEPFVSKIQEEIQEPKEELIVPDEPPAIEFALFGEIQDEPALDSSVNVHIEQEKQEEEISIESTVFVQTTQVEIETKQDETQKSVSFVQTTAGSSLLDQLSNSSGANRLADQLKKSRIESILAVLTLNDKIRFTKNLFDSNSDTFNAAIQLLDAQKSILEARDLLSQYAARYEWNLEDKNTIDFYEFVERRYA